MHVGFASRLLLSPALRCRPRMAAAAAGINKQGAAVTMEPCIRHGRGAHGHAVKVDTLSLTSHLICIALIARSGCAHQVPTAG